MMLYADPGSGVLIWQLLLALFFGLAFYFSKIRRWVTAKLRPETQVIPTNGVEDLRASRSISESE